jgi:hypothetical protein
MYTRVKHMKDASPRGKALAWPTNIGLSQRQTLKPRTNILKLQPYKFYDIGPIVLMPERDLSIKKFYNFL